MIEFTKINLSQLQKEGKTYNWKRPSGCPKCKQPVWGHGYVSRYFNDCSSFVYLKRWFCPHCSTVTTMRPASFWRRFQEKISKIYEALIHRVTESKWPPWTTRQRAGNWMRRLKNRADFYHMEKQDLLTTLLFFGRKVCPFLDGHSHSSPQPTVCCPITQQTSRIALF